MIKKEGEKYILYTSDGKRKLGTHHSHADAARQEAAIKISEAKRAKK